ncbi:DUF2867 domain-containing protein [Undibacterium sp.]|jgi:hypothetical protein|uniref:DUF2867 domain-containing protein n=1 Tax=Undibacterium sp. TaxID=1914977 RepID=UPI002C6B398E|nr:DUF2867 domain-containing protein [Undibacterium sp.]HTD02494.1 DUF2867 domain-containing protein [Undibacterium sp.]
MKNDDYSVKPVALPGESRVAHIYGKTDLADAYAIRLPEGAIADPELLARFVLSHQAPWVASLMRLRDALVAGFGIKTSKQLQDLGDAHDDKRIYLFRIYATSANEILLGEDDKHLDFRLSVLHQTQVQSTESSSYLVLSTVVHCHNFLGRAYILLIAPFHRLVVQSSLRRAARAGWPTSL